MAELDELAEVLAATVADGASVSFVSPFTVEDARRWWETKVMPSVAAGERLLLVKKEEGRVVATVQVVLDMPPNQPHRAEVSKLLVHPAWRRRGLARALMLEAEEAARAHGRTLITLDTRTGDLAEQLYLSLGYQVAGVIPDFARHPQTGALDATTILYKRLD